MKKILTITMLLSIVTAFSADIIWKKYREITSDVFISSTDNLIIEAGTIVRFNPDVTLTVYGQITSNGTETEPVILAALDRVTTEWDGIVINSLSGNNVFNYTSFNFMNAPIGSGNGGLSIFQSNASLNYCKFINCHGEAGGAIKITGGNVTVQNTYFTLNGSPNGGAMHIYNDSNLPSLININSCQFQNNDGWSNGGAIYIKDNPVSPSLMDLNITRCLMFDNHSGLGGAVFYQNEGMINAEISKCRILRNTSDWGSAIYARFQPFTPGAIPLQKFANLLVYKNAGLMQSGIYLDMGQTSNPTDLKFTNATIAFNTILSPQKAERLNTSGIYIKYNGLSPKIENTTLWGNTDTVLPSNFWIDAPIPEPANIFWYCDIQNFVGGNNISAPPVFIRPPQNSLLEVFDVDRYDLHEALGSPVVNAGDPAWTDPDGTRLNIGAYGGTLEATKGNYSLVAPVANTDVSVSAGAAMVLDFQGKSGEFLINNISMGQNSQLFLKSAENVNILTKSLTTPPAIHTEFDGYVSIEASRDANTGSLTVAQGLTVSDQALINNANFYNVMLNIDKAVFYSSVTIKDAKFFSEAQTISPYAVNIVETDMITIQDSKFVDYESGICVGLPWSGTTGGKNKESINKIKNNTISFNPNTETKGTKAAKRVGITVSNANIDIEDNEIEGGDEGIVMKTNSSGRIANNTVSFDADVASKKVLFPKTGIILSDNSISTEISNNVIINEDDSTASVTGIEINGSTGNILYNSLGFESVTAGTTRTGIKVISPTDTIRAFNNTIYNTLEAFNITQSASPKGIKLTNNIFWSEQPTHITINTSSYIVFNNNCFIDSTNVSGSSNIYIDPQINAPESYDFTLDSESPCVNAGIIISGIHDFDENVKTVYYYGTAPDIGAEELYQDLTAPVMNTTTSVAGGNFTFGWSAVEGYNLYKIYSCSTPYGTYSLETTTSNLSYTVPISVAKKFYYVVASSGTSKSGSFSQPEATITDKKPEINDEPSKKNIRIKRNSDR